MMIYTVHYVKGMKLWIDHEGDKSTLRGVTVFYSDTSEVFVGEKIGEIYEFHLQENEKIVKADIRMRWMGIDQMTFYTNKQDVKGNATVYGPYGDDNGGVYSESPPGSCGYLAGVSATRGSALSLQFTWRTFVFPGEPELPCASYKVNDRVLSRCLGNFYCMGAVTSIEDGQVRILYNHGSEFTCSIKDISAVIPDVPHPTSFKKNSHVIVSCEGFEYHTGYVVDSPNDDGTVDVACDKCIDNCITVNADTNLRLFPEHKIPHSVGARVFAQRSNGLYYHGFITSATDSDVYVTCDDANYLVLSKSNRNLVILDVLPQATEIQLNDRVIAFRAGRNRFYPGHVTKIKKLNEMFKVQFDNRSRYYVSLLELRLIPRE